MCVILVLVVLLQSGKGADLGGSFWRRRDADRIWQPGTRFVPVEDDDGGGGSFHADQHLAVADDYGTNTGGKSILETTKGQTAQPAKKAPPAQPAACAYAGTDPEEQQEAAEAAKAKQQAAPVTAPARGRATRWQTGRIQAAGQVVDSREEFPQETVTGFRLFSEQPFQVPKWWNWQTRHLEGVVGKLVGVRVPPSAPISRPFRYSLNSNRINNPG